ncbi:MAG: sialidase family protein [Acidobacteriota bacterium]
MIPTAAPAVIHSKSSISRRAAISLLALLGAVGPYAAALPAAAPTPAPPARAAALPRIEIGPNILVSRDGDVPHVEAHISANPKRTKSLLGGVITAIRPDGGWACRTYASNDGGMTWRASEFAEQVEYGGGDPYTAFTPQGTAIFTALDFAKDEKGRPRGFLRAWRSQDGGFKWSDAMELGYSYDHEQIIVDQSHGKYSGRIYIGVLYGYPVYKVGVFRSEDDGRSWVGPVEAANGGGTIGINDVTPVVLSDGTLFVPYGDFQFMPEKRQSKGRGFHSTFWTVASTDGGVTFGAPQRVVAQQTNFDDKETFISGFGKFAADADSTKYRDRIYFVWEDSRLGSYRIHFTYSKDRGKTWSALRAIDDGIPKTSQQFQPAIAVNKDGVVGVTWFDTRNSKDNKHFEEYFAASVDGGDTFLPPVLVSSAPSDPGGRGNSQIAPLMFKGEPDSISMSFLSAASRWGSGGDYMGLAADREGAFHPLWTDARSGTFQLYTSAIRVVVPADRTAAKGGGEDEEEAAAKKPSGGDAAAAPARVETRIDDKVEFIFDPTRFEPTTKQVEIPMRLKNTSGKPIYPPIRLEILGYGFPKYESEDDKKRNAENAPSALNADNGKPKEGAVYDFKGALGTAEALEPGAVTNPVVMRFQLVDPTKAPGVRWKATGMTGGQ